MTCFSWTLPSATSSGPTSAAQADATLAGTMRALYGFDIWLDISNAAGPDRIVTAAGDWQVAVEREAVRQSLLRRTVTTPGEWKTKPGYGVGARAYVKKRATKATVDELVIAIRGQYLKDRRVEAVLAVTAEWTDVLLRLAVATRLKGDPLRDTPLLVTVQVR